MLMLLRMVGGRVYVLCNFKAFIKYRLGLRPSLEAKKIKHSKTVATAISATT